MTPNLEAQLTERFAELCYDEQGISCSIGCGDGWYSLLVSLFEQLEAYIAAHPHLEGMKVVQVKQKLGQLRVYLQPCVSEVAGIVAAAEARSRAVCELTEEPGATCIRNGYYRTLSPHKAAALGFVPVPPDPFGQDSDHKQGNESKHDSQLKPE